MNRKLVVVTGAAGALGSAISGHLSQAGWTVAGVDVGTQRGDGNIFSVFHAGTDLTDDRTAAEAMKRIHTELGPMSALLNIAGGFAWETILDGSPNTWDEMYTRNVKSCLISCQCAIPFFSENGGAILNVSAEASRKAGLGMGAYAASKSGVSRLTEALSEELKDKAIRVNAVLPTIIDTPANREEMPDEDHQKWVRTDELAQIAEYLIGPGASAINGVQLTVRGRM